METTNWVAILFGKASFSIIVVCGWMCGCVCETRFYNIDLKLIFFLLSIVDSKYIQAHCLVSMVGLGT